MLRKKHCKTITIQRASLSISQIDKTHLAANSELDGSHKLTAVKCIPRPQHTVLALAIWSKSHEILVNYSISSTLPITDFSST